MGEETFNFIWEITAIIMLAIPKVNPIAQTTAHKKIDQKLFALMF